MFRYSCAMVDIRLADKSDLEDLHGLVCSFREELGRGQPDDLAVRQSLRRLLAGEEAEFLLVINDAGVAVGYVQQRYRSSLWLSGLEATLEDLYVAPEARRLGYGTFLVRAAIERASEKGCKAIGLDTNESNLAATVLYEKLGFTSTSTRFENARQLSFRKTIDTSP